MSRTDKSDITPSVSWPRRTSHGAAIFAIHSWTQSDKTRLPLSSWHPFGDRAVRRVGTPYCFEPPSDAGCLVCVASLRCSDQVRVEDGEWVAWSDSVPKIQLEPHRIVSSDVVITTTDTVR